MVPIGTPEGFPKRSTPFHTVCESLTDQFSLTSEDRAQLDPEVRQKAAPPLTSGIG